MMFLVFTASAGLFGRREPAPLFPDPVPRLEVPELVRANDAPTDCPDAPITRGEPVPVAVDAQGRAACSGTVISPAHGLELAQARKQLGEVTARLPGLYLTWTVEREACEQLRLQDHATIRDLARETRGMRVAAPALFVAGVALGIGGTIGVLAAAAGAARAPR